MCWDVEKLRFFSFLKVKTAVVHTFLAPAESRPQPSEVTDQPGGHSESAGQTLLNTPVSNDDLIKEVLQINEGK